ncbi:SCO1664 family protein [Streptomyces sp. JH002]|uniref:SCO1664 family protein n=1 Tax=Streptomyces sp. JH002 TaxID=2763259 RepID=UPI003D803A06
MPAPERVPAQPDMTPGPHEDAAKILAHGTLTVLGRIPEASNAVLYATAELGGRQLPCVCKPVAGERPLWDFPEGNLARREVAAYEVCRALGWDLVPPTVLREGPHGETMCQLWVGPDPRDAPEPEAGEEQDTDGAEPGPPSELLALTEGTEPGPGWRAIGQVETGDGTPALLVHADDERLRRVAVLDAVINNGDRKGGHLLPQPDGRLYGIDHGVTFHTENKLRTLLWGWAGEPLPDGVPQALRRLSDALADPDSEPATRIAELISPAEYAALRERVAELLRTGRHPLPGGEWPAIPWPLI